MSSQHTHTTEEQPKKRRVWPWITLAVILLLIGFVRYAVQADWFFNQVRQFVERTANDTLNGELRIDHISGDLFSDITIRGIELRDTDQNSIASIDSVAITYAFRDLVFSPNTVETFDIYRLDAQLVEDDRGWNLLNILPDDVEPDEPDEEQELELPELAINHLALHDHQITVSSPNLPDERASIEDLNLLANLSISPEHQNLQLESLNLRLTEGRLDSSLDLATSAQLDDDTITLESLTLSGAHTMMETAGDLNYETEQFNFRAVLDPLGYEDVTPYVEDWPIIQDVSIELSSSGNFSDFEAGISLSAPGLEYVDLSVGMETTSPLSLTSLRIETGAIDPAVLMDEELPRLSSFLLDLQGNVPVEDWETGRLAGSLEVTEILFDEYRLDNYTADIDWQQSSASVQQQLFLDDEQISVSAAVNDLFGTPDWDTEINLHSVNPALWAQDEQLEGSVNGAITADGSGFELADEPINYLVDLDQIQLMDETIQRFYLSGYLTDSRIVAENRIDLLHGSVTSEVESLWNQEPIEYEVFTEATNVDITSLSFIEDIPTDLNFTFEGSGSGIELEELDMRGRFSMSDSRVDDQHVESISSSFAISNEILTVEETLIESGIADGRVTSRYNLADLTDIENRLNFDLQLKDLQPLAAIAGADTLAARGNLEGVIQPDGNEQLIFDADLALTGIAYDSVYVDQMNGRARSDLTSTPAYELDLEMLQPGFGDITAQDMIIQTEGRVEEDLITGNYTFEFNIDDDSGLLQQADYHVAPGDIRLSTNSFNLFDPTIEYYLSDPFDLTIHEDQGIVLDTVSFEADDGSSFSLSASQDTTGTIDGHFSGSDANLGTLQSAFIEETYFEGILSGTTRFTIADDDLVVESSSNITQFNFQELAFDLISLDLDISDQRLVTDFYIDNDDERIVNSNFNLPFEPATPEDLGDEFFDESVEGYFNIGPVDMALFDDFLENIGVGAQSGTFAVNTDLSGVAGSPELFGEVQLYDGRLSGVEMDTLQVNWDYVHADETIMVQSYVESLGQRAFDLEGRLPFYADFQTLEVEIPDDDDEIEFRMNTTDFRLEALNDFIDPEIARNLRGLLNTDINIGGTLEDPQFEGNLMLSQGTVQLVPNNIRVRNIELNLGLEPEKLSIHSFQARSNGLLTSNGEIQLDGFNPESFDINVNARNLEAFATNDISAFVSLNTRLSGTMDEPRLTGSFQMNRGGINLTNFGERTVEDVQLDDEEDQLIATDEIDFFDRLGIEMNVTIGRNVFLRNRRDPELNLALQGELEVVKDHFEELEVFGDINIPSGHATTLGKRFDIERGVLLFSGVPENPELDIRAMHRPRQQDEEIRIYYVISGTVDEPDFAYESEPEMEFQDIISYTLFGRPFEALAGWERSVSGRGESSMASDLAMEILLDRVEALAADRLGIDVIEIDNSRSRAGSGTTIKAGKYLTDRVFVAYLQELGGTRAGRQVIVEYLIRSNLELVITGSDDYRSGVDLMWRFDY